MATSPVQGDRRPSRASPREGHSSSPESSLTWCLAHLSKPRPEAEHQGAGKVDSGASRDIEKRFRIFQWRALVAIRTQHIKGDKAGIARFRTLGGLRPLLDLLKHPDCPRKVLDLALSILANCCTEMETRIEVRKLDGISILVDILKRNVALETVQNRAARALGNLAMDPDSSVLIHSAGGVPLLLHGVSFSTAPTSPTAASPKDPCPKLDCAQSAARALLYLSDTPSNRLSLLTQGTLSALAPLIGPEFPKGLRKNALRTLHELTRGCGVECAREVSRSGVLAQLGAMVSGETDKALEELALKTLANLCSQGCLRPLVGSLGAIPKFTEEVKKDPLKSGVYLKALCLCCKEAVNRAKVKESGGLEALIGFLSAHKTHPLSRLAILACADFVFDESAMEQLQELGLVPLLVAQLVELTSGEEPFAEKMDVSTSLSMSPAELLPSCFNTFDFPHPESYKKEEAGREQGLCSSSFLSLRSWLVAEGFISSEGDLLASSSVDGEWGNLPVPPSSSPQTSSPIPESTSSVKNISLSNPPVCLAKKAQPLSSVTQPSKTSDSLLSVPQPPSALTPHIQPNSSTKTSKAPVSPTKFSSPQRRRQRAHSATSLTKVILDTPPSVSRPVAYYHPYHPEPWTPESPILLLLSRFSHATDPSASLVSAGVMSGLLSYLTGHQDPSSRCFRILCRLSCNPNCLQALVRTGSVALIHYHLCQRDDVLDGAERESERVKGKVNQLGFALLNNLRVQCESGFGSGVLAHVMLSGSESDKMNCALSLPLISSNKSLLKKLLLDTGGLLLALQPLGFDDDVVDQQFTSPHPTLTAELRSLYFPLLVGCLSKLTAATATKLDLKTKATEPVGTAGRDSPPPSKRARLGDVCPYGVSNFNVMFLLDNGIRVPANREAVAGAEDAQSAGSEYFRALLRGGFDEAQANRDEPISIRDVSAGTLLPVLHYLHGCRLRNHLEITKGRDAAERRGQCQVLDALVTEGLNISHMETGEHSTYVTFQETPLGEVMVGACRFLVTELQQELEDLCVSFLLSCYSKPNSHTAAGLAADGAEKAVCKMDHECLESAEESLASRTSELELTGLDVQTVQRRKPESVPQPTDRKPSSAASARAHGTSDQKTVPPISQSSCAMVVDKAFNSEQLSPKVKPSDPPPSKTSVRGEVLVSLLPQMYVFSQRHSYPALRRASLSLLLGGHGCPWPILSPSLAGDCLRRLAREADCTETLKRDLVGLATAALS